MHHCNVDRLWAMWQIDAHGGAAFYPAAGEPGGHNLNDAMWPWVGAAPGYSSNNALPNIVLPNFAAEAVQTPADMLDHHVLGYAYDTEPVIALALDQTGSMTGETPDPLTGMAPNISKWAAARQGVSFFLHDCETAYAAREAYVTAGVQTFRALAGNQFTKLFAPGTPYGLIKNGTAFSRATFDANAAALTPGGATPLAGALTDSENTLVRPPFGDQPADQRRYLAILTDGIETAAPLLNTLPAGAFPDTVIFAMGFGIGGGWDGVDYATLANVVAKGQDDPNIPDQVFHGENAAVIDKFYTNALAASIGYTPAVDPVFELFPGEHVHFPFDVTDAEHAFMIAAQGFDFTDRNWDFCLMGPDGVHCCDTRDDHAHDHAGHDHGEHDHPTPATEASADPTDGHQHDAAAHHHPEPGSESPPSDPASGHHGIPADCPCFVTMRRHRGRCTIFVNRNGTPSARWVGRWALMAFFRPGAGKAVMLMPGIEDFLVPVGSPPVRGPVYLRFNQPVEKRPAVRLLPGPPRHRLDLPMAAPSAIRTGPPCALSIQVHHRTTLRPRVTVARTTIFAGDDIELRLDPGTPPGGQLREIVTAARLVAPAFSLGNILADTATIPLERRGAYAAASGTQPAFNELQFLADYEAAHPGAFALRDEEVVFKVDRKGAMKALIKHCRHPGIYRVAVYVEGSVELPYGECCAEGPQRFSRVLHLEVAVGIRPDPKASRPALFWTAPNQFTISVTPTDRLGNIAVAARTRPVVTINGKPVSGVIEPISTGELRVSFTLEGKGVRPDDDGQSLCADATVLAEDGITPIKIARGKDLKVAVTIGSVKLPVVLPRAIQNVKSAKIHPAGSAEAMRIPLEDRRPLRHRKDARRSS